MCAGEKSLWSKESFCVTFSEQLAGLEKCKGDLLCPEPGSASACALLCRERRTAEPSPPPAALCFTGVAIYTGMETKMALNWSVQVLKLAVRSKLVHPMD